MASVDFSGSAMIALYPRENEATALALDGEQPAEDLHVTMLYLGSARDAIPLLELTTAVVGGIASETEALAGTVGGVAQFEDGGDGAPLVLLPDVPGLTELGAKLREELARVGVESASEHGFQPHLTVSYGADPATVQDRLGADLHFDTLSVVVGNDRFDYPLQSPPQTLLSAGDHPGAHLPSGGLMGREATVTEETDAAPEDELDELAARVLEPETLLALDLREAEAELAAGETTPLAEALAEEAETAVIEPQTNASQLRWEAVLMLEGEPTDDGRMIDPGAITWRDLPLSLMGINKTTEGHAEAQVVGRIDEIWRAGNLVMGRGVFDDGEFAQEIARLVSEQMLRGVSVDLAIRSYELRPRDDSLEQADEGDLIDQLLGDVEMLYVVTEGSIGAATIVPFPAFADAEIALVASAPLTWRTTRQSGMTLTKSEAPALETSSEGEADALPVVTASAAGLAPLVPPAEWFEDPKLEEPTPLQITEDGRIFGHAAVWDVCHIGFEDACVLAPHSPSGYRYFHLGEVLIELQPALGMPNGEQMPVAIPCGQITLGTGHASLRLSRADAVEHYDDTGTLAAHAVAGEDEHGIWFAGALSPDLPEERVRELRGAKISGDWRSVGGELELVAMLAVNVPGFPVPRVRVASGAPEPVGEALVAAGVADRRVLDAMRERDEANAEIETLAETQEIPAPAPVEAPPSATLAEAALTTLAMAHARTAEAVERVLAAGPENGERAERELAVARQALDVLAKFAAREAPPAPDIHVHAHVPEREVTVEGAHITVEAAAPPDVTVEPQIDVHVPEQPAPQVLVAAPAPPQVTVEAPKPRTVRVEEDEDGTRRYISEEE